MRVPGAVIRRFGPSIAVGAVLLVAALAPIPTLASSTNNCGVKNTYGYAFHDHGKPCPNRPFPGHGKGALAIMAGLKVHSASQLVTAHSSVSASSTTKGNAQGTGRQNAKTTSAGNGANNGKQLGLRKVHDHSVSV